ncbi:MAG: cyclic nucleotide-binding domain-containing protein [Candidatus Cloacimonetes bacterium]|nr:cyclic nucleotide-binding domain-containing protein [Candidatus Cloacimonadota bacterium]
MNIAFLKNVDLFKELTSEELKYFASKMHVAHFKETDTIIKENEDGDKMFILFKGEVQISIKMTMIDEQIEMDKTLITLRDKDYKFFGEIGLLDSQKRTATVIAKTNCTLYTINRKVFLQMCSEYPKIGVKILLRISEKLAKTVEKNNINVLKLTTALIYALK